MNFSVNATMEFIRHYHNSCQGDVFFCHGSTYSTARRFFLVKFCMSLRTARVMLPRHALRGIAEKRGCEGIADREQHEDDVVLCSTEHDVFYPTGVVLCSPESYSIFGDVEG